MDVMMGNYLIQLRERIVANFNAGNWEEIGLLTGQSDLIDRHPRLLRSLSWGDEDYSGNVLTVLKRMVQQNSKALRVIESYLDAKFPGKSVYVSAKPSELKITFAPNVFKVPDARVEPDLVALMMPYGKEFSSVHSAVKKACRMCDLRCLRADDIWEDTTIVQDIFNLVFRAQIVVVDFTGKNPNVMYETGIAHTLGKHVVPITQTLGDTPFDLTHHRVLKYLPNAEGLNGLSDQLAVRLKQVTESE